MMKSKIGILVILLLAGVNILSAQIEAPDLFCTSSDTLNWNLPTVDCNTLEGFEIYSATDINGPYTLIETINDPGLTSFPVPNVTGELRYYYMRSIADCPGETILNSDTLNNQLPPTITIKFVTANENGDVRIEWKNAVSNEDIIYRVYRTTSTGTVNIGDVTDTFFVDTEAVPSQRIEYYNVVAVDQCNNQGLYGETHQTIFLSDFNVSICDRSVQAIHNGYEAWGDDLMEYRLMVSRNGEPFAEADTYFNISDNLADDLISDLYCFRIDAAHQNGNWITSSNTTCFNTDFVQPAYIFNFYYASHTDDGNIQYAWEWNNDAAVENLDFAFSTIGNDATEIEQPPLLFPISANNSELTNEITSNTLNKSTAALNLTDSCGEMQTKTIDLIGLSGSYSDASRVNLNWTPYSLDTLEGFIEYSVLVFSDDNLVESISVGKTYSFTYDASEYIGQPLCFKIIATYDYTTETSGEIIELESQSNRLCIAPEVKLFFPNALALNGSNNEFGPVGNFKDNLTSYSLKIYTRSGRKIFETNDVNELWNGYHDGIPVASGIYTYKSIYTQDGTSKEVTGIITVLE